MKELWAVGQFRREADDGLSIWDFQGIFTSEAKAVDACQGPKWYVWPVNADEELPERPFSAVGAYYPLATEAEEDGYDAREASIARKVVAGMRNSAVDRDEVLENVRDEVRSAQSDLSDIEESEEIFDLSTLDSAIKRLGLANDDLFMETGREEYKTEKRLLDDTVDELKGLRREALNELKHWDRLQSEHNIAMSGLRGKIGDVTRNLGRVKV